MELNQYSMKRLSAIEWWTLRFYSETSETLGKLSVVPESSHSNRSLPPLEGAQLCLDPAHDNLKIWNILSNHATEIGLDIVFIKVAVASKVDGFFIA